MTVVCGLSNMLKELRGAIERSRNSDESLQKLHRPDVGPIDFIGTSVDDIEVLDVSKDESSGEGIPKIPPLEKGQSAALMRTTSRRKRPPISPGHSNSSIALRTPNKSSASGEKGSSRSTGRSKNSAHASSNAIIRDELRGNDTNALSDILSGHGHSSEDESQLTYVGGVNSTSSSIPSPPSDDGLYEPQPLMISSGRSDRHEESKSDPTFKESRVPPSPSRHDNQTSQSKNTSNQTTGAAPAPTDPTQAPKTNPTDSSKTRTSAASTTKLVTFELPLSYTSMQKETITPTTLSTDTSALSKLLGASDVQVYVPGLKVPIDVKILATATMQQLVVQTIKVYNGTKPAQKMESDPDAYNICIALPDGTVDTMFGIISKKVTVDQWAEVAFILVENQSFKKAPAESSQAAAVPEKPDPKVLVRITLPTGAYHTLPAEPSLKIGKLLTQICEKRQLIAANYTLVTAQQSYLSPMTRISDLKDLNLELKPSTNVVSQSAEELFHNDTIASQLRVFQPISFAYLKTKKKINPATLKFESVSIAIDGEKIVITPLKKTGASSLTLVLADLRASTLSDESPNCVTIESYKEKDRYLFEASTAAMAKEIEGKISYLIELNARTSANQ